MAIGRAAARVLPAESFLIGRDTCRSGPMLQAALCAGMASEGANVVDLGVLPTPGVAWLSERRSVPAAVVSASHNPFSDNGVKLFAAGGLKLPDSVESSIEEELVRILEGHGRGPRAPVGHAVGTVVGDPNAVEQYSDHLVGCPRSWRTRGPQHRRRLRQRRRQRTSRPASSSGSARRSR